MFTVIKLICLKFIKEKEQNIELKMNKSLRIAPLKDRLPWHQNNALDKRNHKKMKSRQESLNEAVE